MKQIKYLILFIPLLLLSGCISSGATSSSGGGFDLNKFIRNPFVMGILVIIAIWVAIKMRK